jgi:hypothetical protein
MRDAWAEVRGHVWSRSTVDHYFAHGIYRNPALSARLSPWWVPEGEACSMSQIPTKWSVCCVEGFWLLVAKPVYQT